MGCLVNRGKPVYFDINDDYTQMNKIIFLFGLIFAFLLHGCGDAPRTNPLDPALGSETSFEITGTVERLFITDAIPGATVTLLPDSISTIADPQGRFEFINLNDDIQRLLICRANGFMTDSVQFNVISDTSLVFKLNALPKFDSITLRTHQEANFSPPNSFYADILVNASDPDAPADFLQVWFRIDNIGYRDTLRVLENFSGFYDRFDRRDLNIGSIAELFGKPITVVLEDANGAVVESSPQFISRIIDPTPLTLSPTGSTPTPFNFIWRNADDQNAIPYSFEYRLEVFLNINIPLLEPEWTFNSISETDTSFIFNEFLTPDEYYWVLYIIDEFGNSSRSLQRPLTIN